MPYGFGRGFGSGCGRGYGRGFGPGYGWGYGRGFGPRRGGYDYGEPGFGYGPYEPDPATEEQMLLDYKAYLEEEKKYLERELAEVNKRIDELKNLGR